LCGRVKSTTEGTREVIFQRENEGLILETVLASPLLEYEYFSNAKGVKWTHESKHASPISD
jgi:hypothetical protein